MTCKPSVRFKAFTPALLRILRAVYAVAPACVITSANDSTHSPNSRHYTNEAIDIRTKDLPTEQAKRDLVAALRRELGPAFTVLYEDPGGPNQHLHLQPRKGTAYQGPV
jgi:hypothetical protein